MAPTARLVIGSGDDVALLEGAEQLLELL